MSTLQTILTNSILLLGWAIKCFRDWTGIPIKARQWEALHSALMTGVCYAIDRHLPPAWAIATAVDFAKMIGSSEAIAVLGASLWIECVSRAAVSAWVRASARIGRTGR